MKNSIPILTFFALTTCQSILGQTTESDTFFIRKDPIMGYSQSIFFETNKNSKFYKEITSFTLNAFDKERYDNSLYYLKTNKLRLQKRKTILPSTKWITLKQYKGQFYAYHPCDFFSHYQVSVNDTTFIDWIGEGTIANQIVSQLKVKKNIFKIKLNGYQKINRTITIAIIDNEKGIAIFTETTANGIKNYLMIMAEKIRTVPFIVNNCQIEKQGELEFEEPNYSNLLTQ